MIRERLKKQFGQDISQRCTEYHRCAKQNQVLISNIRSDTIRSGSQNLADTEFLDSTCNVKRDQTIQPQGGQRHSNKSDHTPHNIINPIGLEITRPDIFLEIALERNFREKFCPARLQRFESFHLRTVSDFQ